MPAWPGVARSPWPDRRRTFASARGPLARTPLAGRSRASSWQASPTQEVLELGQELEAIDWLCDVIAAPACEPELDVFGLPSSRHQNDRNVLGRISAADLFASVEAVELG